MKQLFNNRFAIPLLLAVVFLSVSVATPVGALDLLANSCDGVPDNAVCNASGDDFRELLAQIITTLFFFIGVAATIAIIVGGFRYITANGDPKATATAKNVVLYAVIGLVVAVAAGAIVNFVLTRLA